MKKHLFVLFIFCFAFGAAYSNDLSNLLLKSILAPEPVSIKTLKIEPINFEQKGNFDLPQLQTRVLTQVAAGQFTIFANIDPIIYEPFSNAIVIGLSNYGQDGESLRGVINVFVSTNYGASWNNFTLFNKLGDVPVRASIGVLNPTKSSSPTNLNFFAYAPFARKNIAGDYPWSGGLFSIYKDGALESIDFAGPDNAPGYMWWDCKVATSSSDLGNFAYTAGMLRNSETTQYGAYGFSSFDFDAYDFRANNIPAAWSVNKFRDPGNLNSTWNSKIDIDVDQKGNVYAAVINFFKPNDQNVNARVPGISKSTDAGQTWSEFEPMPVNVLTDYVQLYNGQPDFALIYDPYSQHGFIVTGEDEYSFFTRVIIWESQQAIRSIQIVEMQKQYGMWTIRPVAAIGGVPYVIENRAQNQGEIADSVKLSPLGNEIQAAKTKDGQHILLKWVDFVPQYIVFNPPVQLINGHVLDTIPTTDVFVSYRSTTEYTWNDPINITQDTVYNKGTFIPKLIPSLNNFPMILSQTVPFNYTQPPYTSRNSYPNFIQQMFYEYPQYVLVAPNINLEGISSVEKSQTELLNHAIELKDVMPNPSADWVEFRFSNDRPTNIKFQIIDQLGNIVETLFDGVAPEGLHAIMFNTSKLANGTYFYRLTAEGKSITKLLNVIK